MKDMLKTLLISGNISKGDIIDALYESEEHLMKTNYTLPKITFRKERNDYIMTIPAKISPTGKRIQVVAKTEEDVITKYKEALTITDGVPTLAEYTKSILKRHYLHSVKPASYDRYETIYNSMIDKKRIGSLPINKVTEKELNLYFKEITSGEYSKQTCTGTKSILKKTFDYAVKDNWVKDNPINYIITSYRNCKKPREMKESFTFEELSKIEETILDENASCYRYAKEKLAYLCSPMFLIMANTGLRIGEMMDLKIGQVKKAGIIKIESQIVRSYGRDANGDRTHFIYNSASTKTATSEREIIFNEKAVYWANVMIERKKRYGMDISDDTLLVLGRSGHIPETSSLHSMFKSVLTAAELDKRTSHKLRKTFVTDCIIYGGDSITIGDVSKLVGHKNITTTLNTYFKTVNDKTIEEKLVTLNNIFDGSLSTACQQFEASENLKHISKINRI